MKTCMIAAPASGSGKTTLTMGLLRALKRRGLDVCGYKTGPDYIDRAFLEAASGKPAGNLDLHLQGETGVQYALARAHSDYCVIEGVMGYFDGMHNTWQGSSYDIARRLQIPTILIYTPGAEMFSIIPKLKGMAEFEQSTIRAVIFNQTTPSYYDLIKAAVADYTDLLVLGFVPKMPDAALSSRHLGLVQQHEIAGLDQKIDHVADTLEAHLDFPALLGLMATGRVEVSASAGFDMPRYDITVAIARDAAFSFYYRENLELLERACRQVVYFSPLRDGELPPCDLLYLGGGYPEVFRAALSRNAAMLNAIKAYAERGGYAYAECGGFMYLTETIDGVPMVGVFKGHTRVTSALQRFGYIDIALQADCLLGSAGDRLTAHEFHHAVSEVVGQPLYAITKALGTTAWECGYRCNNVLAGYPHLSFPGNLNALKTLLSTVVRSKARG